MDSVLDPEVSTLVAQVRKAEASHKMDASNYLRSRHFQGPSNVVYLGDVGQAVLSQLSQPETPSFSEAPGYNEQRWTLETTSGELSVSIRSRPYWAWGLLTSGYLNIITLRGPLEARSRLVLDVVSSLGQPPWEFAHARQAGKYLAKNTVEASTKSNEHTWKALLATGRDRLAEQIERMVRQREERPIDESDEGWNEAPWMKTCIWLGRPTQKTMHRAWNGLLQGLRRRSSISTHPRREPTYQHRKIGFRTVQISSTAHKPTPLEENQTHRTSCTRMMCRSWI